MNNKQESFAVRLRKALNLAAKHDPDLRVPGGTEGNQSELARRSGVKPQAIQYLMEEDGKREKRSKYTPEIARALRVTPEWLTSGTEPMLAPDHWESPQIAEPANRYDNDDTNFDLIDLIFKRLDHRLKAAGKTITKAQRRTIVKGAYNFLKNEENVTPERVDNVIDLLEYKENHKEKDDTNNEQQNSHAG